MTTLADQKTKTVHYEKARFGDGTKRIFDVLVSALGLLILSPVFIAIALYIKRNSPGPVFYRGPRAGLDTGPEFGYTDPLKRQGFVRMS
ncbi:MAG: sugar transferase [Anaerolineales bacterium]|jgi:lipopolysaccharide/colanic/teichoic acid biosynthesis glycosyltransferase